MNKLTQITEFQPIVCKSSRYEQQPQYEYLDENVFKELEQFIKDYDSNSSDSDATDFFKIGFKKHVGDTITSKNYVGLIELKSGYKIQILPKLDLGESISDTMHIFVKMLCSMKDFPAKIFDNASQKIGKMNLYEIFIRMYIEETRKLVKKGIKSAYIREDDNLNFFKGKLLINEHIKNNVAHRERFYVAYDEYLVNRPENKLIKSTLIKLKNLTENADNNKEIRKLLTAFEVVETSNNYVKDFSTINIDRSTKEYELLMQWSKVFLLNKSFTTLSGNTSSRALLFPMDRVFEAYVAKELKKIAPPGWRVSAQDRGYYLFDAPSMFRLRPDIVITIGDKRVVLDTKWKRLIPEKSMNYGISQADMYQMYAYSKKYHTSEIWLLYPYNKEMEDTMGLSFKSIQNEDIQTNIRVFFVDFRDDIKVCLGKLVQQIYENDSLTK